MVSSDSHVDNFNEKSISEKKIWLAAPLGHCRARGVPSFHISREASPVQGYLAHKKQRPPRTLQQEQAQGPIKPSTLNPQHYTMNPTP